MVFLIAPPEINSGSLNANRRCSFPFIFFILLLYRFYRQYTARGYAWQAIKNRPISQAFFSSIPYLRSFLLTASYIY